jgi:hypothetical protein
VGRVNVKQREQAARSLIGQIDEMIQTNLVVREMLHELREAAEAVLNDIVEG